MRRGRSRQRARGPCDRPQGDVYAMDCSASVPYRTERQPDLRSRISSFRRPRSRQRHYSEGAVVFTRLGRSVRCR